METLVKEIKNDSLEKLLQKAINTICWDNWTDEDTGEPMKLGDVYNCKLDWLKESLDADEHEEFIGMIEDIQETIVPILNQLDKY